MNRLGGVSVKAAMAIVAVIIVAGGFALALLSTGENTAGAILQPSTFFGPPYSNQIGNLNSDLATIAGSSAGIYYMPATNGAGGSPQTVVIKSTTASTTTSAAVPSSNVTSGTGGSLIEFSSTVDMQTSSPSRLASEIVALAYSEGGYVAYQSTQTDYANVVIRVPAASYQSVLAKIQGMGNVTNVTSNSNDVTVQYTDLNATLRSLLTEQAALLRLANQSTTVNSTLAIETQLQGVNQQINFVQSQILQTARLVAYSTISVSVSQSAQAKPLSMVLSVTPKSGVSPLSVTMNAVVTGGIGGYLVNYNFGDGTSAQGQILVHTFVGSGDYNVTVDAADQNGSSVSKWVMVHVSAAPNQAGFGDFPGTVTGLFFRVVEGIVEAAVVVIPLALVAVVVLVPIRRWTRGQKPVKQSQ